MLHLHRGTLLWGERDFGRMVAVVGADAAITGRAPLLPSIVKLADKKGVRIDKACKRLLKDEEDVRALARELKKQSDATALHPLEDTGFTHQRVALQLFRTMKRSGYLVTDATGVGKTWEAIMWAKLVAGQGRYPKLRKNARILVVTKNAAKEQWVDAIHRYVGKREQVTVVDGTLKEQRRTTKKTRTGWVIAHWESLSNIGAAYIRYAWDAIILDEAHYIGNRKAQRSGVAYKLKADDRMALTAHPYSNDPGELFAILRFLYPTVYRSYWRFFHMHVKATPKQWGGFDVEGPRRPKLLRWELEPITIGRSKQEVFKSLPAITRVQRNVSLTARGEREYAKLRKELFVELDALDGGMKVLPILNDLSRLTRTRQYLIDPALIGGREKSVKYPAIYDLMGEINAPLVVFTDFKQAALGLGAFLKKQNKDFQLDYIHGGMQKRIPLVKKKFLGGALDALIVVSKAGNEALNLGKYGYVAHLDLPWTPRELEQAEGRVDRPEEHTGKLVPTTAFRVIVRNSYEERHEQKLIKKHGNFTKVFTVHSLRELFA